MATWQTWTQGKKYTLFGVVDTGEQPEVDRGIAEFWIHVIESVIPHSPGCSSLVVLVEPVDGCFTARSSDGLIYVTLQLKALKTFNDQNYPGVDEDGDPLPGEDEFDVALTQETIRYVERFREIGQRQWRAGRSGLLANRSTLRVTFFDEDGLDVTFDL